MSKKKWHAIDNIENAEYIGILEIPYDDDECAIFEVVRAGDYLVYGTTCNVGFFESGHMKIDNYFSFNENLQALNEELERYYRDGARIENGDDMLICYNGGM